MFYEADGRIYIGQFKKGEKHGKGCIIKNGYIIFEGQFDNGYPEKKNYIQQFQKPLYPKFNLGTEIGKAIIDFVFGDD